MTTEIAVISGKGGTGKTTITAAFASIAKKIVLADCDVDAPDLHILLQPNILSTSDYIGTKVAIIDESLCTNCGLCEQHCRYDAAHPPVIDPIACEGCGVCEYVCPETAVRMEDNVSGLLFESETRYGPMAHARLHAGEGNSGKVVTEVRKRALDLGKKYELSTILIDGSPGIGCPVIATVTGIHLGVIVTEPTLSGIHDMKRVLSLMKQFKTTPVVIINKFDLNPDMTHEIESFCKEEGIEVLGTIPFDSVMTKSMVAAKTLPEFAPDHPITHTLEGMWQRIIALASK
ncbi:MAG: 4Fe-4S binding protein [Candidatus Thorarchaeota archaeon]|nr:4Fe-4S binding protein [Candidatus Thorarchaeota archaeon]